MFNILVIYKNVHIYLSVNFIREVNVIDFLCIANIKARNILIINELLPSKPNFL